MSAADDRDMKKVLKLSNDGDYDALVAVVDSRTTSASFMRLLATRDRLFTKAQKLDDKLNIVKGTKKGSSKKGVTFVKIREATLKNRATQEQLMAVNSAIDSYREVTAAAAFHAAAIRESNERASGTFVSYDADTIGSLVALSSFDSGTPEWHAERQEGIGGSDISKIMRTDPLYGAADYRNVLLTKLGLVEISEDDEYRDDMTTAVGRGNAWEEFIRYMYADKHPDQVSAFCKTSWGGVGGNHYKHANFDGLILDDKGTPVAVKEIKTGVHSDKWGEESDGLFGAPANYRVQILWYAMNAGLKWGVLVAVLDDYDYREYKFSMDDPRVQEECAKIEEATAAFWATVQEKKSELAQGIDTITTRRKGFTKTLNMKKAAEVLSSYTGENFDEVYSTVREAFSKVKKEGASYSQEQIQKTLTKLYASHDPNVRCEPLIGIDIETNHAAVKKGRIIETGIVQLNADGTTQTLFSSVHGLPKVALEGLGSGDISIHRITAEMIDGSKAFDDEETQSEILAHLKSGVIVAHNAGFEDRFLTVNLAGYAEARDAGEIRILDTKELTSRFMLDSENNSLQSFAEDNGVPYVGAHAATADTLMMMLALRKFQETLFKKGKFASARTTKKARVQAEKEVIIAEESR